MKPRRERERIAPPAPERLPAVIESLLFVAEEPQEIGALAKSLNVPRQRVERALETRAGATNGRGLFVQRMGDRVQIATIPEAAPYIERFLEVDYGHLSRAALETLAIIAYRQPVTRASVEAVRGVNSDHAVATLLSRGLIEDVGRAPGPGRPVLFSTTIRFLEYFGLQRPDDLPPLPEAELPAGEQPGVAPPSPEIDGAAGAGGEPQGEDAGSDEDSQAEAASDEIDDLVEASFEPPDDGGSTTEDAEDSV
jgi:segregation and condensation protein B